MSHRILWNKDGVRAEICTIRNISFAVIDKSDSPHSKIAVIQGSVDEFIRNVLGEFAELSPEIEN